QTVNAEGSGVPDGWPTKVERQRTSPMTTQGAATGDPLRARRSAGTSPLNAARDRRRRSPSGCLCASLARGKSRVQSIKHECSTIDAIEIGGLPRDEARQQSLDARCFGAVELRIFHINVVNDLGDLPERGVRLQTEPAEQGLECAAISLVRELRLEHVESQLIWCRRVSVGADEDKSRLGVDEPADQPCASNPVDKHAVAGDPGPPA